MNTFPSPTYHPKGDNDPNHRADILSLQRNEAGPVWETTTPQYCEQARHPNAVNSHQFVSCYDFDTWTYLVIESTLRVKMFKECSVRFSTPKIHVGNFEVTPDLEGGSVWIAENANHKDCVQWHRLYDFPLLSEMNSIALSSAMYSGCISIKSRVFRYVSSTDDRCGLCPPVTVGQRLRMVAEISYTVIMNPRKVAVMISTLDHQVFTDRKSCYSLPYIGKDLG